MSHPVRGKRMLLSIFLLFLFLITASNCFAAVYISNILQENTNIYQGSTGNAVMRFSISFAAPDTQISRLTIQNNSNDVPFGDSNIDRFSIHSALPPTPGNKIAEKTFSGDGVAATQFIDGLSIAAGTYYIAYDVDQSANASDPSVGGIETYAQIKFISVLGDATPTEQIPAIQSEYSVKIMPSGLSYDQSLVKSMVPTDYSIGAGFMNVPMMSFRLRANNQNITVNSITIMNGTAVDPGNFAPNFADQELYVKYISIYEDTNGNEYFDGFNSVDILVGTRNLGVDLPLNTLYEAVVTINNNALRILNGNTRVYFVFYNMGVGMSEGDVVQSDLGDAVGQGTLSGPLSLNGVLPASADISLVLASVNAEIVSATPNIPTSPASYYAIAGERQIPMIKFTLDTTTAFSDAKFTIKNAGGTFLNSGEGVSKVSLYRDVAGTLHLIGATSTFAGNNTAEISDVYLPDGVGIEYYVYYDINVGAISGSDIQCQIDNIEGNGMTFGGTLPAPQPAASFLVTPAILRVYNVSENVNSIEVGAQFPVQIVVRNVAQTGGTNVAWVNSIRPTFYYQDIGGTDISAEYSYTLISPNYRVTYNTTVTYDFLVRANNMKTNGPVIVDAFIDYKDIQWIANKPQSVIMDRYRSGGSYVSAALGSNYGSFVALGGTSIPEFSLQLPDYITSMNVIPYGFLTAKPFMNGDLVAKDSKLVIYFANQGDILDMTSLIIKKDDVLLSKGTDYLVDESNGTVTIQDMGGKNASLSIDGYSGDDPLATATITYYIETGFKIKDVLAGPSPYKPSQGSMYFSFQLSEAASITIYVYDSAGQLVWKSESTDYEMGYGEVAWDGTLDVGGTVGRGVYLVRIVAKASDDEAEKTVKTKFAVF